MAQRAFMDEPVCGDACAYWEAEGNLFLCIVDGLGHGPQAAYAAERAIDYMRQSDQQPLPALFAACDQAIRDTRGVALGVVVLNPLTHQLQYAAVGNTQAVILGASARWIPGSPGIVGAGYHKLNVVEACLAGHETLVLHTDGVQQRFTDAGYAPLLLRDPQDLAEHLLADWRRPNDDAAVLVCCYGPH